GDEHHLIARADRTPRHGIGLRHRRTHAMAVDNRRDDAAVNISGRSRAVMRLRREPADRFALTGRIFIRPMAFDTQPTGIVGAAAETVVVLQLVLKGDGGIHGGCPWQDWAGAHASLVRTISAIPPFFFKEPV